MSRWYVRIAPLALAIFQLGCTQAPPPAPDTRAADEKAIRDSETQWVKDFTSKDMDKIVGHYADDGSVLMPNITIMTGKDAIRAGLKGAVDDPNFSIDLQTGKVEVSKGSDLAYTQGTYTFTGSGSAMSKPACTASQLSGSYSFNGSGYALTSGADFGRRLRREQRFRTTPVRRPGQRRRELECGRHERQFHLDERDGSIPCSPPAPEAQALSIPRATFQHCNLW